MPVVRRLIPVAVLCVLATLAVTAFTSAATLFTNPTRITIPGSGNASPYPSEISVSGTAGPITDVTASRYTASVTPTHRKPTSSSYHPVARVSSSCRTRVESVASRILPGRSPSKPPAPSPRSSGTAQISPTSRPTMVAGTSGPRQPHQAPTAKDLSGNGLDQNPNVTGNQQKVWSFTTRN